MTAEAFSEMLRREGFSDIVIVEREPNGVLDAHAHPFVAKALILDGKIRLVVDRMERIYRPGDIFHLKHGETHVERYGPSGVRYLVGKK